MTANTIYGFSQSNADRLLGLIRENGGEAINRTADTRQHVLLAVSGGVTARSSTTLGTGEVIVKSLGYSGTDVVITDAGYNLTVYNLAGTAVANGAYVLIHRVNTFWIVIWEECPE